jgi:hypothetical protein
MTRLLSAALVALVAASLAAGCGEDSGDDPPSKQERRQAAYERQRAAYIEETDGYCRRLTARIERELAPYRRRLNGGSRAAAAERLVAVMAPRVEFEIRTVRSIVLPERDVEEVLRMLSAWDDEVQRAKRNPLAFVEAEPPFPEAERLARRYGFRDCGALWES